MKNEETNLMMVAAYHKQVYNNYIADQITLEQLKELNEGIVKAKIMLKTGKRVSTKYLYIQKRYSRTY